MDITLFALSGALIAISSGVMAFGMFAIGQEKLQKLWGTFCLIVFVWGIGVYVIGTIPDQHTADTWWRILHVNVAFMPVVFLHFVYAFLKRESDILLYVLYGGAVVIGSIAAFTLLMIADMRFVFGEFYYDSPPGPLYELFVLWYLLLTLYSHTLLYKRFRSSTNAIERQRIQYFFISSGIGFAGASMCFLPVYGIDVYPIANFLVVVYPIMMGYAIFRYKLFDIRAATAQGLILLLWIFLSARLVLSTTQQDFLLNGILLLATIVLGYYLVRSISHELKQREEIQRLSDEKSEFMTFASHEIRNPITAMRGFASLIADGTTGPVASATKDAAEKILVTGNEVLMLIAQFLSKSKLELGKIEYLIAPFDIACAVSSIADGYEPHAKQKGLTLVRHIDTSSKVMVKGDEGKLKEVVANLLDNALKYTREGSITVVVRQHGKWARVVIEDTGVGIPHETLPQLFKKFSRADAQKVNLLGTGIGLYLARTFIEGQGGSIKAESAGKDKGSRFIIEMPLAATEISA